MKIIILKTQSFSDIVTNSSSELFVVKGIDIAVHLKIFYM